MITKILNRISLILFVAVVCINIQTQHIDTWGLYYTVAFVPINKMLSETDSLDFKRVVLSSEDVFIPEQLVEKKLNKQIPFYAMFVKN